MQVLINGHYLKKLHGGPFLICINYILNSDDIYQAKIKNKLCMPCMIYNIWACQNTLFYFLFQYDQLILLSKHNLVSN